MTTIWYFTKARETRKRVAITSADFQYLLCVLPPLYAKGCYGMSEPVCHNTQGEPEYLWFTERGGAHFCFHGTRAEAETEFSESEVAA